ncbi:MAG: hypothetical protein H6R19_3037 [Proteobacteria bacterium]|nr:hypothetical protein [Pseudomonadota bacterium]
MNFEKFHSLQNYIFHTKRPKILLPIFILIIPTFFLYYPYLSNALIFDDYNIFNGNPSIYDYALTPFNGSPRTFPLFTLGFVETIWHSIEIHRCISLVLHILNSVLIFRILQELPAWGKYAPRHDQMFISLTASLFFALHPAATYGAAYLAQRTILIATLFSLLAFYFFLRGLNRGAISDSITAAVFYTLAVFSKEHAIMLPAAILPCILLYPAPRRKFMANALTFAIPCALSGTYIILRMKGLIGAYEPLGENSAATITADPKILTLANSLGFIKPSSFHWFLSITQEAGLFFHYLTAWLLPNPNTMSIDIRIDFLSEAKLSMMCIKIGAFIAFTVSALLILWRGTWSKAVGLGMLYMALMYLTEFSGQRLQEPFVLYRSYLWAPGIAISLAAILAILPIKKHHIPIALTAAAFLFIASQDRLESMHTSKSAWEDAEKKLTSTDLPGSERIYYNIALNQLKDHNFEKAIQNFSIAIDKQPNLAKLHKQRGYAFYSNKNYEKALSDFSHELTISPNDAETFFAIGLTQKTLGNSQEAHTAFEKSSELGYQAATLFLPQKPIYKK